MEIALLIILCVMLAAQACWQFWNFHRARHLLRSGGWSVFHATYGGTISEWHYSHKGSKRGNWSLGEAYERQLAMDKRHRLDLPQED